MIAISNRFFFILLSVLLAFGLGIWATKWYFQRNEITSTEKSTVLLEKIKSVTKLVTVEGYFSEIYDYKDYYEFDWSPFRKKALLRVKAKVSVGYDLGLMKIESFPDQKKIVLSNIPDPEILSIDHDIDYYDVQEGTFNSFTAEDYTMLNARAKQFIESKARESDLFVSAEEQGNKVLDLIKFITESAGWTLEYQSRTNFENEFLK